MTYMYYGFIGCMITVIIGIVLSWVPCMNEVEPYDEKLIHPFARKVASFFPGEQRRYADKMLNNSTSSMNAHGTSTSSIDQNRTLKCYSQDVPLEDAEIYNTKL